MSAAMLNEKGPIALAKTDIEVLKPLISPKWMVPKKRIKARLDVMPHKPPPAPNPAASNQ